jgi:hypothetical protein
MFYKQRKMEAENQLFFNRVVQLPVIKAASDRAVSVYGVAKNSNRLFNATFQLAENGVKYVSEVEAVKKILDSQIVSTANKVAVSGLDKIENDFPVVKKTPEELWAVGTGYYEQSRLKGGVDTLYSVKDFGVTKVSDTKKYYQDFISAKLTQLLDLSDAIVDKYVAVDGSANGQAGTCGPTSSYTSRVQCISGKFYRGVKHQAGEKYVITKEYALQTLGDLHMAMLLLEHAKNTATWMNEKTHTSLTTAQEQAKALWYEIQRRAEPLSGRSEAIVLTLVQGLAANVASLSQQVAKYSAPYLPEGMEKTVAGGAAYAVELRDAFAKAKSLGDIRDEVIVEAKDKLAYVQDAMTKGIDYLAELPPISWLTPTRSSTHSMVNGQSPKAENGHVIDGHHQTPPHQHPHHHERQESNESNESNDRNHDHDYEY